MSQKSASRARGFTLLEFAITVIIILSIVAYALARYIEIADRAKITMCKSALVGIRASILLGHMEAQCRGLTAWPSVEELKDNQTFGSTQMVNYDKLPNNPFSTGKSKDEVVVVDKKPAPRDTRGAWAYNPKTGEFWANTASGRDEVNY